MQSAIVQVLLQDNRPMHIVYSDAHYAHAPAHEFLDGKLIPYQESPRRAEMVLQAAQTAGLGDIIAPRDFGLDPILQIHDAGYVTWLQHIYADWVHSGGTATGAVADTFAMRGLPNRPQKARAALGYYSLDATTVHTAGTWAAAYQSAQCALTAAQLVVNGASSAFALCRPPGHHAHADLCGGYCLLNNAAIVAHWLTQNGNLPNAKVAILDVDFHHGNGTQAIFYARSDVFFISLHADPERQYPYFAGAATERGSGAGLGYTLNYPLPAGIDDANYLAVLKQACAQINQFAPSYLVVSLGVDTFGGDPLGDFALTPAAFAQIGGVIATLNLPTVFIMEGGYAIEQLGQNVINTLRGKDER